MANFETLAKYSAAQPTLDAVREFIEWCDEQHIELSSWAPSGRWLLPISEDREALLMRFAGIDAMKLENERRALLDEHDKLFGINTPSTRNAK